MLNIENQIFVTLTIDGNDISGLMLKEITAAEGNGAMAPTVRIALDDPSSQLAKTYALSDGNKVELVIAKSANDPNVKPRKYRLFGPTRDNASLNPHLLLIGVLDAPMYFTASNRQSFPDMTTDEVMQQIADECDLTFSGPSNGKTLNDRMKWLDVCVKRSRFIHDITRHGYIDKYSCMESAVTSFGELRYRDVLDEVDTTVDKIKYIFAHSKMNDSNDDSKTTYLVKEAKDQSVAGLMNHWVNYGSTRSSNNIDGKQKNKEELKVETDGGFLAINEEVKMMVDKVRLDYAQLDSTNTHENYQTALYQNVKQLALFTESMALLVIDVTEVQIFDPVIYRQADAAPEEKTRNEDVYIVVGKTIVIRGGIHYAERIQLARISLDMKGAINLETSEIGDGSSGGSASAGPDSNFSPDSFNSMTSINPTISQMPSLIPASNINMSAIGQANSSMPMISNLSSQLTQIAGVNGNLSNISKAIPGTAQGVLGSITNVGNLTQSGASSSALQGALTTMWPQVVNMAAHGTNTQQATGMLAGLTGTMAQSMTGLPSSMVTSAISAPNSVVSSLTTSMKATAVMNMTTTLVQQAMSLLPASVRNTPIAQAINSTIAQTVNVAANNSTNHATVWNTALGAMTGQVVPAGVATAIPGNDFQARLAQYMARPGVTQAQIDQFIQNEMIRTAQGAPNWMNSTATAVPPPPPVQSVQQLPASSTWSTLNRSFQFL